MGVKDLIVRVLYDDAELDKVKGSESKLDKLGSATAKGAAIGAGALAILGGAAINAATDAANLEVANDRLAASMGLTEAQSATFGDAVSGAYQNAFGESREAVDAAAQGIVTSIAGMRDASVEHLQGITEKVLTLSDGFELEADRISQVVGQMLSTGLADSAEEGLDLLTVTLQKVPAAVRGDVLDAVDEYGPFFAQVGLSGEDAMSMLVAASEKGMYGIDKTGDAVKEFGYNVQDLGKNGELLAGLGLSAEDMAAKFLAGGDTSRGAMNDIIDGLLGIQDPVAQSAAAVSLFGVPLEDLNTGEIPGFLESLKGVAGGLGDVEGAADQMAATAGDNVATTWVDLTRTFEGVSAELGEALLPVLSDVVGGLKGFADWASNNTETVRAIAIGIGIFAAGLVLVKGAMTVVPLIQGMSTAVGVLNGVMRANPVLAVVGLVVTLVAALVTWFATTEDGQRAWGELMRFVGDTLTNIGNVIGAVVGWFGWLFGEIGRFTTDVIGHIGNFFGTVFGQIGSFFGTIGTELGNWWGGIIGMIEDGVGWIGDRMADIGNFFGGIGDGLMQAGHGIATAFAWLWNNTIGALHIELPGFLGFPGAVIDVPNIVIPALAAGGVALGPTLALIGEDGPEAVVPLSEADGYGFGGNGGPQEIVIENKMMLDGNVFWSAINRLRLRAAR